MKAHSSVTHQRTVKCTIDSAELHKVIAEAVAKLAAIDLDQAGVTYRVHISRSSGSVQSDQAEVTILEDLHARPTEGPKEQVSFSGSVQAPITVGCTIEWWEDAERHYGEVVQGVREGLDLRVSHANGRTVQDVIEKADSGTLRIIG